MATTMINGINRGGMANVGAVAVTAKVEPVKGFGDIMTGVLQNSAAGSSKNFADTFKVRDNAGPTAETPVKNNAVKTNNVEQKEKFASGSSDKINAAAGKVAEKIEKTLGVSDEELEESMEILGLSMADLLQPGNIAKLLMQLTGVDDTMLLITDPELSGAFKEIMNCLDNVLNSLAEQFGVAKEDLPAVIAEMADAADSNAEFTLQAADEMLQSVTEENEHVDNAEGDSLENVIGEKLTVETQDASETKNSKGNFSNSSDMNMSGNDINAQAGSVTQNISQSFETAFAALDNVNATDVVRQVVDSIKLTNTQALQSMEVQLTPENLCKVNILVSVREGVVTAQITAESEQVKRALESQMLTLKENFENQGLKVEAVEVTVRSSAFESNSNFNGSNEQQEDTAKSKRAVRLDELDFSEEDEMEVQDRTAAPVSENSSVEFMA